jgi:hypothetical protein
MDSTHEPQGARLSLTVIAMTEAGEQQDYTAHFTREEVEERIESGELDLEPDFAILPNSHHRILKYLSRADNPEDLEPYRRLRSEGVAQAIREAVESDNRPVMAYFRGWKSAQKGEEELIPLLMSKLQQEAMTVYIASATTAGKTHFMLLLCQIAVDLCDYEAFVTNVPLEAETKGTTLEVGGALEEHGGVAIPARWNVEGRVPELEWQADVELVKEYLRWHIDAGLPLEEIVATTEEHVRAVAEVISGRVFIGVDEYGTSGGGVKGHDPNQDRPTIQFARAIRKDPWNASIAMVGHSPTDISRDMRALVKLGVDKPGKRTAELYEDATRSGFENQLGPPFDVGGHRLDDYNDKVQPPWEFMDYGDDEEDEETAEEAEKDTQKEIAQNLRDKGMTVRETAEMVNRSRTWVSNHTD